MTTKSTNAFADVIFEKWILSFDLDDIRVLMIKIMNKLIKQMRMGEQNKEKTRKIPRVHKHTRHVHFNQAEQ